MRCDTSELLFEGLLEGTLPAQRRKALDAHLECCAGCRRTLEELRVIDALLLTPRTLEPPPNFTFKTMAETRSLPPPHAARARWPWLFLVYLIGSWVAIATTFAVAHPDAYATLTVAHGQLLHVAGAFDGIARVVGTGFGLGYAGIAGAATLFLLFDLALVCCAIFVHAIVRPRLANHLARGEAG
jgi:anti-sigma factor RsiW